MISLQVLCGLVILFVNWLLSHSVCCRCEPVPGAADVPGHVQEVSGGASAAVCCGHCLLQ